MRNLILFGLLILLLLVAQFASGKTVDEIIERYLRARGGRDKLAGIKSIYLEGTKHVMGEKLTVKILKEQDKLSRTELETEDANSFLLITDIEAWTLYSVKSPEAHKIPEEDAAGFKIELDIAGPLVDYISKGYKAELLGKEIVEENTCYKIKLTTREAKEMMFWIDVHSYLVIQSSGSNMEMENGTSFTLHKNYKEVAGIQFAHTFESISNKKSITALNEEINFHKILVNPVINPKIYQPT